jgi:hypothetical protein
MKPEKVLKELKKDIAKLKKFAKDSEESSMWKENIAFYRGYRIALRVVEDAIRELEEEDE